MNFWKIDSRDKVKQILDNLAVNLIDKWDFTKPVKIEVKPYTNPRSLSQNALLHIWFKDISDSFKRRGLKWYYLDDKGNEIGEPNDYEPIDIKFGMKHMFLGYENIQFGKIIAEKQLRSTSKLDKGEMMHLLNQVYSYGMNNGAKLVIPQDSEYQKLKVKQNG